VEVDARQFRNALGRFATGVTVITASDADRTHGMTVNSFVSVSLDPPLVLVSLDNRSSMHNRLHAAGLDAPGQGGASRFGISVLTDEQEAVSNHFAGRTVEGMHVRFITHNKVPLIEGALAHFVVQVTAAYLAGDHTLYLGRVEYFEAREGRPLLFHSGRYRHLQVEKRGDPMDEFSLFSIGNIDPTV
jgi:flavin reductase (DIM6/NTAB) family NADH-FMN oxidoreductase RutF